MYKAKICQEVLRASPPIIDCIDPPPPHCQQNRLSTKIHQQFVDKVVQSLVINHCVVRVDSELYVCNPLL